MQFRFPGPADRTTVIGATGSGKTTCGVWLLSAMPLASMPWVVIDFKRETLFDQVGMPPIREIDYGTVPKRPGLYILSPNPGEEEPLEDWLWRVWERENTGLYIDEAMLMPDDKAMRAILQQGRSKRLPVIACTQRPVTIPRAFFSEASFFALYRVQDRRDYDTVRGFVPGDVTSLLPEYHWRWYDVARNLLARMSPVPADRIVPALRGAIPVTINPFAWMRPEPKRG